MIVLKAGWPQRRVLICIALILMLNTLSTAAGTLLWVSGHTATQAIAAAAPVLCMEDDMEDAVPASGGSSVFEVQAVMPQTDVSAEKEVTPDPDAAVQETVELTNEDRSLRVEVVRTSPAPDAPRQRILIYHTHTWEAFQQVKDAPYQETEKWRSKDNTVNMVAVGDALTAALTAMGFEVVHDTTAFEPPNLSDSYKRSLIMLEQRTRAGEQYDLYIDLHRDAFSSANAIKRTVSNGGETLARIMVLVGKGEGYDEKPDWQANLEMAECITDCLNRQVNDLGREVKLKTGRFNQHIAPHCVLIECGCNYNTLEEVLRSMPYLAQAIADALTETSSP